MTRAVLAVVLAVLFLAGCSGGKSSNAAAAASAPATPEPTVVHASGDPGGALSCKDFLAAATSGAEIDGYTPIAWTTRILEQELSSGGQPVPARTEVTTEFYGQVVQHCTEDPNRVAPAVAAAVYEVEPSRYQ